MPCVGLVYRGRINNFYHKGTLVHQTKMVKLKRQSCRGCEQCSFLEEDLNEFLSSSTNKPAILPEEVIDGKLYTLQVTNISRDYESGFVDDYDLEFVRKENGTDAK